MVLPRAQGARPAMHSGDEESPTERSGMVDGNEPASDGNPTAAARLEALVTIAKRLEAGSLSAEEAYEQATQLRRAVVGLANRFGDADDAMRAAAQVTATLSIRLDEGSPEQCCAEELARGLASSVDPPLKLDFEALAEADALSDQDDDDDEDNDDDDDDDREDPGEETPISGREWIEISQMTGSRTFALEVRGKPDSGGNTIQGTIVRTVTWGAEDPEFAVAQSWLPNVSLADLHMTLMDAPCRRDEPAPKKGKSRVR